MEHPTATNQLIELAARLVPTGEIGDGMVAQFHELAERARLENAHDKPLAYLRAADGSLHFTEPADLAAFPVYAEPFSVVPLSDEERAVLARLRAAAERGKARPGVSAADLRDVLELVERLR